jgi:hypothetical protein
MNTQNLEYSSPTESCCIFAQPTPPEVMSKTKRNTEESFMAWSEQTKEALQRWLSPQTWYKSEPREDARFSVFVASVWNDEHSIWDETLTHEEIRNRVAELHLEDSYLAKDVADSRVSEGTAILDFLSHVRKEGQFALLSQ